MKHISTIALVYAVTACSSSGLQEETAVNARPMTDANAVAYGDCVEARRRAAAQPDLDVDSVPRPVSQRPPAFVNIPDSVRRQLDVKGSSIKVDVIVDTLGRPDMRTFKVVTSTHPWLAQNIRAALPTWRFRAARLAGCKVARVYHFSATSRPRRS